MQNLFQIVLFCVYIHYLIYIFSFWSKCLEYSVGMVVILTIKHIGFLTNISSLKQIILDQSIGKICIKQFYLLCTFIIWSLFSFWSKCSENSPLQKQSCCVSTSFSYFPSYDKSKNVKDLVGGWESLLKY